MPIAPTPVDPVNPPADAALLSRAFRLAEEARAAGDHPFGALLAVRGRVVAEARNRVNTTRDVTAHAETELVRAVEREQGRANFEQGVVYASCEPCPMCVGAMFWAGARHVVFGLSSARLNAIVTAPGDERFGFAITAAGIGRTASPAFDISGPWREDEAAEAHVGFWH